MKKFLFLLLLIFTIPQTFAVGDDSAIREFLQKKLLLQNFEIEKKLPESLPSTGNFPDIEDSLILDGNILVGEISLQNDFTVQPYWTIVFPDGHQIFQNFPPEIIAKIRNNEKNISLPIFFQLQDTGEYRIELLGNKGHVIFSKKIPYQGIADSGINHGFSVADVLRDMNHRRKQIGIAELNENPLLQRIALSKVRHMADFQYVGHETLDGKNIFSFVDEKNKKLFFRLGENVAGGTRVNLQKLYQSLLASPSHAAAMMSPDWTQVGMFFLEKDDQQYFVQIFAD